MNIWRIVKFITMILLLFLFTLVAVANRDPVTLKLLPVFSERASLPPLPLSFVLFMSFLFGILLVGVYAIFEMIKQNLNVSKLKKENSLLQKEISNLRQEPLMVESKTPIQGEKVAKGTDFPNHVDASSEDTLIK